MCNLTRKIWYDYIKWWNTSTWITTFGTSGDIRLSALTRISPYWVLEPSWVARCVLLMNLKHPETIQKCWRSLQRWYNGSILLPKSPSGNSDGHCEPLVHIPTKLNLHLGSAASCGSSVRFETRTANKMPGTPSDPAWHSYPPPTSHFSTYQTQLFPAKQSASWSLKTAKYASGRYHRKECSLEACCPVLWTSWPFLNGFEVGADRVGNGIAKMKTLSFFQAASRLFDDQNPKLSWSTHIYTTWSTHFYLADSRGYIWICIYIYIIHIFSILVSVTNPSSSLETRWKTMGRSSARGDSQASEHLESQEFCRVLFMPT